MTVGKCAYSLKLDVAHPRGGGPLCLVTAMRSGGRLGGKASGVANDPHPFRSFGVARVPAFVVVPGARDQASGVSPGRGMR